MATDRRSRRAGAGPHERPARRAVKPRPKTHPRPDPLRFIRAHMRVAPVPTIPEIRLYMAHQGSGLWRLGEPYEDGSEPPAPYWAFPWAGGLALARHILERPDTVAGRRVLDLGSGSGLVAIAAAMSGAREVMAADVDRYAVAAIGLNAAENGVAIAALGSDLTTGRAPAVDLVMTGDLFYERELAERVTAFLTRCARSDWGRPAVRFSGRRTSRNRARPSNRRAARR